LQIPVAYVITVIGVLAGAIGVLFKLYLSKEQEVRTLEEKLLAEKDLKVNILVEFNKVLEKLKNRNGDSSE
jgi:hypothetical protein